MDRLTPAALTELAGAARSEGHEGLAELFESVATKLALFNERSATTVEEALVGLGDEAFLAMLERRGPG